MKPWLERRNQQKQLWEVFCKEDVFEKMRKIHSKIPVLESVFNEFPDLETYNFIKK